MSRTLTPPRRMLAALSIAALSLAAPVAAQPVDPPALRDAAGLPTLAPLLSEIAPAVVSVSVEGGRMPGLPGVLDDPSLRHLLDAPVARRFGAEADPVAGVIVDAEAGHVLTSRQVLARGGRLTVTLGDGRTFEARPIASDAATELAVLRIDAENLPALALDDSGAPQAGDYVLAIGGPSEIGRAMATGLIGGAGPDARIRTDAEIEPGGALVALDGRLIGIVTASDGATLAVTAEAARAALDRLASEAADRPGRLGVAIRDAEPDEGGTGAVVMRVAPESAAAAAGLVAGDVIVAVDGRPVAGAEALRDMIAPRRAGDAVVLDRLRRGVPDSVRAVLFAAPEVRDGDEVFGRLGRPAPGDAVPDGPEDEPTQ